MKVIYADSLFALSLVTDYLLCLATARFCRLTLRRGRYLLAALLGAVYAVAVFLPGLGWLASVPVQLAAAGLMGLAAFGGEERLGRCMAAFLALSATFGGMVWAAAMRWGSLPMPDARLLLAAFGLCYALLTLLSRTRHRREGSRTCEAVLFLGGRRAAFRVLRDTAGSAAKPGEKRGRAFDMQVRERHDAVVLRQDPELIRFLRNGIIIRVIALTENDLADAPERAVGDQPDPLLRIGVDQLDGGPHFAFGV